MKQTNPRKSIDPLKSYGQDDENSYNKHWKLSMNENVPWEWPRTRLLCVPLLSSRGSIQTKHPSSTQSINTHTLSVHWHTTMSENPETDTYQRCPPSLSECQSTRTPADEHTRRRCRKCTPSCTCNAYTQRNTIEELSMCIHFVNTIYEKYNTKWNILDVIWIGKLHVIQTNDHLDTLIKGGVAQW